ncbi:putative nuclease HARBI1 [Pecten maximus]|uniref:putative nuclease HARBI1 n=1 Tax=Pecten maximus TaxID=6579 RepID=UPI001458761E|nr:putative nuclease HARBI1 [Pecten maximus]
MADPVETAAALVIIEELFDSSDDEDSSVTVPLHFGLIALSMPDERAKIRRYAEEVIPMYTDEVFRRLFRMSRDTFSVLVDFITECPDWQRHHTGGYDPIPVDKQLYVTLWYLGGTDTINKIADRFGIGEASVIECRKRIIKTILNHLKSRFIKWPSPGEMAEEADVFSQRNGFPGIIGALDGTHIHISKPKDHPQSYFNRKGYYSIQMQAVCRHDMRLTHVFVGYPGSCHDARVLKNSDIWNNGLQLCNNTYCILADGAYPIRRWLLTPYRDNGHLGNRERRYNHYHSSCRVVIERSFGLLKGRFRRLQNLQTSSIKTACQIIMASSVLHNICILQKDEVSDFLEEDGDQPNHHQPVPNIVENDAEGVLKRNIIANRLV